ncbi:MAG: hypothetical protein RE468_04445 [Acidithiobacillus caldus]|uniref:hypothetical protein n=1 Tax=Acidithiobacillus caldus TaxID=33059 RepID=UPI001C06583D|nr:hypothetical protein [Acidithiobacillus caldus]MBU2801409.1 hypothetical protein [Acidithiobacillus caldus]WMT47867.1 MAG: hypothetical protein RE468_04445 [Acidithiobacillus caldus]
MIEKTGAVEPIATIRSRSGRVWNVLSWSGEAMIVAGEYDQFESRIRNAIAFGTVLVESADPAFRRKWESVAAKVAQVAAISPDAHS